MPYVTHEEYVKYGFGELTNVEFDKLLPKASAILDNQTNHFFQRIDIETYNTWIVDKFKQALCSQIEYFQGLGASTFESINSSPQSFSAGRTSVSQSSRYRSGSATESKPLIAEDVYIYLEGTGLLYRGISVK